MTFTVNELAKKMHAPTQWDMQRLKRMIKYLMGKKRVVQVFEGQAVPSKLLARVDTDHAGDKISRKSTTCMQLLHGKHLLKSTSSTQRTLKLSSGESEYSGIVKGMSGGLGMVATTKDMKMELGLTVQTDSSSAKAMATRRGLGKVRHIASELLWVQQVVAKQRAQLQKIDGKTNTADLGTKFLTWPEIQKHMTALGFEYR